MNTKQTPLHIAGISENLYAGFWARLGSILLDALFILPFGLLILALNSADKNMYLLTAVMQLLFVLWYHVYLPKKYGGTPGKLIVGIKIIRIDGQPIEWSEAVLRQIVSLGFMSFYIFFSIISVAHADGEYYQSLNWGEQARYINAFSPEIFILVKTLENIWVYGELIVLLTNKRKRAIHDYIARTVVIKAKYAGLIQDVMESGKTDDETSEDRNLGLLHSH